MHLDPEPRAIALRAHAELLLRRCQSLHVGAIAVWRAWNTDNPVTRAGFFTIARRSFFFATASRKRLAADHLKRAQRPT